MNGSLRERPPDAGAGTEADPATLVRNWAEAATLLEAACAAVAAVETPETVALQEAADLRASAAFAALAACRRPDPALLRGHADALEWLMRTYGSLSDGPHDATLGRSIAHELRLAADLLAAMGARRVSSARSGTAAGRSRGCGRPPGRRPARRCGPTG